MTEAAPTAAELPDCVTSRLPQIATLCQRYGVRRLDLFGSAVTGRFDPDRSDLDFLVDFAEPAGVGYANACFRLRESLEQLFARSIDLLTDSTIKNPYLRRQVESEKRRLYPLT